MTPTSLSGWSSWCWAQAERGWNLPRHLAVGDVLEFGLAMVDQRRRHGRSPAASCAGTGGCATATELAFVVDGPYADPASAADVAHATLAELRLSQLPAPAVDSAWLDDLGDDRGTEP